MAIVAVAVHHMAHTVPGLGIAVPILHSAGDRGGGGRVASRAGGPGRWPTSRAAWGRWWGGPLNLGKIRGLGAPVASIGGAGKFDGIFMTGIVAVLLAGFLGGAPGPRREWSDG